MRRKRTMAYPKVRGRKISDKQLNCIGSVVGVAP